MIGGFPPPSGSKEERRLLKLFRSLTGEDRLTLLKFAEFLGDSQSSPEEKTASNTGSPEQTTPEVPDPLAIERPAKESVIKAIKRLNKTYFMLDTGLLLDKTSDLMTQHILKGRDAAAVIDDLELLFKAVYDDTVGKTK